MGLNLTIPKLDLQYHTPQGGGTTGNIPLVDLLVYIDGSSRPNPGVMRVGVAMHYLGREIHRYSEHVGTGSNNNAEFCAMIQALQLLKALESANHPASRCKCAIVSDSTLLVDAIHNKYPLKQETLKEQLVQVLELMLLVKQEIEVVWVPRKKNNVAHNLSYTQPGVEALPD